MASYPTDIFTEPEPDPDTLSHLGPLRALAGIWEGMGVDIHPVAEGTERNEYSEHYELQPIDAQTNGPQLFYGLRYHTHIVKPGEVETFHDQVGYWLWEPATGAVILTLSIPRAQVALASGVAAPDATQFEVTAMQGTEINGICSNPFLNEAYRTIAFRMLVTINPDGTWSYDQDTTIEVKGRNETFHHTDQNTLAKIAEPTANPLARQ